MTPNEYLLAGEILHKKGHKSDGCTFIQWFVRWWAPHVGAACRSHDFGFRRLIPGIVTHEQNDKMFRYAVRSLGHPVLAWAMYLAVAFRTRVGVSAGDALAIAVFGSFFGFIIWHAATR